VGGGQLWQAEVAVEAGRTGEAGIALAAEVELGKSGMPAASAARRFLAFEEQLGRR